MRERDMLVDLDDLEKTATRLNASTDRVMKVLRDVERYLNGLNIGIEVSRGVPGATTVMGFGKTSDKKWGFFIVENDEHLGIECMKRLDRCSLLPLIPALIKDLTIVGYSIALRQEKELEAHELNKFFPEKTLRGVK